MTKREKTDNGIRVDLLRKSQLGHMGRTEKIRHIIDHVREGRVVVLESGLSPDEHALLIEKTMTEIDHDEFKGVDVESYPNREEDSSSKGIINKIFSRKENTEPSLTVIGPASRMKTLHKDDEQISTLLTQE